MGLRRKKTDEEVDGTSDAPRDSLSRMLGDVRDPTGKLNLRKVLGKTFNPATLVALVVAGANQYMEYQDLKVKVREQATEISQLKADVDVAEQDEDKLTDAVRDRFVSNEQAVAELKQALSNLQVELRVRFGVGSFAALPRQRREEIQTAIERVDQAMERVDTALPEDEPLAGIE